MTRLAYNLTYYEIQRNSDKVNYTHFEVTAQFVVACVQFTSYCY